jgi:hypothetical protein
MTEPSIETPPKRPLVLEYVYLGKVQTTLTVNSDAHIAATRPPVFNEPEASPVRPTGPTANDKLPPKVIAPADMNDRTADFESTGDENLAAAVGGATH